MSGCLRRSVRAGQGDREGLGPLDVGVVRDVDREGRVPRRRREPQRPSFRRVVLTSDGRTVDGSPLDRHVLANSLAEARRERGHADVLHDARRGQNHRRGIVVFDRHAQRGGGARL